MHKQRKLINGESFNIGPNIKSNSSVKVLILRILKIWGIKTKIIHNKKKQFAGQLS